MSYLRHLRACNAHDLSGFRPWRIGAEQVGWVRHRLAERLLGFGGVFVAQADGIALDPALADFAARTQALADVVARLVAEGTVAKLRDEPYPVLTAWGAPALCTLDRAAVAQFGIRTFGLHVNGYVRHPDGALSLWVGRRARDKTVAPGQLDNLIAGGQPHGLTLEENLIKEAKEEADIDPALARRAHPCGAITYCMETADGLKADTLFVYDLAVPPDFVPRNTDGEVEEFFLWPIERVAATVHDSDDYKFNCNLVVIDFLIRHGRLRPDEPDYLALVKGLHR